MATAYKIFLSHMHALLDLQHGPKSLAKLGDLLVGQNRTKISAMSMIQTCCHDLFFKPFVMTITQHTSIYNFHTSNLFLKKYFFFKFLSKQPLLLLMMMPPVMVPCMHPRVSLDCSLTNTPKLILFSLLLLFQLDVLPLRPQSAHEYDP